MTLIPYPQVPNYPGVPPIPRTSPGTPSMDMSLAPANDSLAAASSYTDLWGIYTAAGDPLYAPPSGDISTFSVTYMRSMQIEDFPIEASTAGQGAAFASFNKVWIPANPVVTFTVGGTESERTAFLSALDAACASTNLYNVVTPEATYVGYSIESYSYQRTAQRGATMLMVEVSLKEILQVSPSYTNSTAPQTSSPINDPQSPSAAPQTNSGLTQPVIPNQSTLSSLFSGGSSVLGVN